MPFAAALSQNPDLEVALREVSEEVLAGLGGAAPDLCCLFVSHDHADRFDELALLANRKLNPQVLIGSTGETVVGAGNEIETGPALSLWAAVLPGASIEPFHVEFSRAPDGIACSGLPTVSPDHKRDASAILFLGEPYSTDPNSVINYFADELPEVPIIGGMASGGNGPDTNRLFLNDAMISFGAIGLIIRGGPRIRTVVSQGCRPIGRPFIVTRAEQNLVGELGGMSAIARLRELLPTLSERDQELLQQGLHLGIVINEYQESFARGDFLISNVLGFRQEDGSIAVGNRVRVGQTVQFHVRDAEAADEDLTQLLEQNLNANDARPAGALLFSCNGRGTRLFSEPNHDAAAIQRLAGPLPLAGFFAQGEFGPVGKRNFIHGFTASIALFE